MNYLSIAQIHNVLLHFLRLNFIVSGKVTIYHEN
jgi:hypothetical protein